MSSENDKDKDLAAAFKELQAKIPSSNICPNCGYCPCCGRPKGWYWSNPYGGITWGGGSMTITNMSGFGFRELTGLQNL